MKPRFRDYLRAAFNARPFGMLVPPNWIGLGLFGLLGVAAPGFWLIGAGLELGYLAWLMGNPRFRRSVRARLEAGDVRAWRARVEGLLTTLGESDRRRHAALEARCRAILAAGTGGSGEGATRDAQAGSLGQLGWMYLRLLVMRRAIEGMLRDGSADALEDDLARIRARLAGEGLSEELRRSLAGQADILADRCRHRAEARDKLAFVESEIARIEQQVELLREQALTADDPEALSRRLDEVTATLGGTAAWVREQQRVYGAAADLLVDAPSLAAGMAGGPLHEEA